MDKIGLFRAVVVAVVGVPFSAMTLLSADQAVMVKPTIAKICTNCHKAEPNTLMGSFDSVAFKAKTIQVKIDDSVELIRFDEDEIKVVNAVGKTGDGELLKDNRIKKGHEIKVEYAEKDGLKTAVKLVEKPAVKIPPEMLITTAELEKLVALGPEKGKYFLFDSRPLPRFQEGAIPTAVNLPYPAFDKQVGKLPPDKSALLIFYCGGPTCNMSPGSADKAKKLGYTNIRVYKDGMPAWSEKNYAVLSAQFLKEAWIDKDIPHVLLDVRTPRDTGTGFIKGAVAYPARKKTSLIKILAIKQKKAPLIVYDEKGGRDAVDIAKLLVKAGYGNVKVLTGGFEAWRSSKYEVALGSPATTASYTPKPRPGEIGADEFRKYAADLPANVAIIDVRNPDEGNAGMLRNARLIPADQIKERSAELPKDKLIVTYCSTGIRAEMAYHTLKELGYTNVRFLNAKMDIKKNGSYTLVVE